MEPRGIRMDDLPDIYREEYLYAVEIARAMHDPHSDWEAFRETLWVYLTRVFGVDDAYTCPPEVVDELLDRSEGG